MNRKFLLVFLVFALFLSGCVVAPVCGDNICDFGEEVDCPEDCGFPIGNMPLPLSGVAYEPIICNGPERVSAATIAGAGLPPESAAGEETVCPVSGGLAVASTSAPAAASTTAAAAAMMVVLQPLRILDVPHIDYT